MGISGWDQLVGPSKFIPAFWLQLAGSRPTHLIHSMCATYMSLCESPRSEYHNAWLAGDETLNVDLKFAPVLIVKLVLYETPAAGSKVIVLLAIIIT